MQSFRVLLFSNIGPEQLQHESIEAFYHANTLQMVHCGIGLVDAI